MFIYKITNTVNGKIYIGKTTKSYKQLLKRYRDEIRDKNNQRGLLKAIRKYGFDKFKIDVIVSCLKIDYLRDLEMEFILQYKSFKRNIGYNMTLGGEGNEFPTQEMKNKISKGLKNYYKTHSGPMLGKRHSQETKLKISIYFKKLNKTPPNKGVKCSKEQIERMINESKYGKAVIAINLFSGIPLYFSSIKNAAKELNTTRETIKDSIYGRRKNKRYKFLFDNFKI